MYMVNSGKRVTMNILLKKKLNKQNNPKTTGRYKQEQVTILTSNNQLKEHKLFYLKNNARHNKRTKTY